MDQKDVSLQLDNEEAETLLDNIGVDRVSITWENIVVKATHTSPTLNKIRLLLDKNFSPEKEIIRNSNCF